LGRARKRARTGSVLTGGQCDDRVKGRGVHC
jgi:hypothetical protein